MFRFVLRLAGAESGLAGVALGHSGHVSLGPELGSAGEDLASIGCTSFGPSAVFSSQFSQQSMIYHLAQSILQATERAASIMENQVTVLTTALCLVSVAIGASQVLLKINVTNFMGIHPDEEEKEETRRPSMNHYAIEDASSVKPMLTKDNHS